MNAHADRVDQVVWLLFDNYGLRLPFFIGGSGGLALRGLRRASDLDIGVPTAHWFHLVNHHGWEVVLPGSSDPRRRCDPPIARCVVERESGEEVTVDAWFSWRWRGFHETEWNDFNLVFREGIELVCGWPCIKLIHLLRMKVDAVQNGWDGVGHDWRPKDLADIQLITEQLDREEVLRERARG